jgi:hypothetical protein
LFCLFSCTFFYLKKKYRIRQELKLAKLQKEQARKSIIPNQLSTKEAFTSEQPLDTLRQLRRANLSFKHEKPQIGLKMKKKREVVKEAKKVDLSIGEHP